MCGTGCVATGSAGDGSPLLYTWAVNGTIQTGRNGSSAALTLAPGDTVSVNASTARGLVSATATVACGTTKVGDRTITRRPVPPSTQVLGTKVTAAVATIMSLPVTGGQSTGLALVALATIAAGVLLLVVGRRRGRESA